MNKIIKIAKSEIKLDLEMANNIYPEYKLRLDKEAVIRDAIAERAKVFLFTKGFRKMHNIENESRVNYFRFFYSGNEYGGRSVPNLCSDLKIEPELIQLIYFYYRSQDLLGTEDKELINEIIKERKQLVTDIFPFPKIHWLREDPWAEEDERFFSLGIFLKRRNIETAELIKLEEESMRGEIFWNKYYKKSK